VILKFAKDDHAFCIILQMWISVSLTLLNKQWTRKPAHFMFWH